MNTIEKSLWNQWFAGVVNGDGCFYINKKQEIRFELMTAIPDITVLESIKNQLKERTIKCRSGLHSIRYRVKARFIIENITK